MEHLWNSSSFDPKCFVVSFAVLVFLPNLENLLVQIRPIKSIDCQRITNDDVCTIECYLILCG